MDAFKRCYGGTASFSGEPSSTSISIGGVRPELHKAP